MLIKDADHPFFRPLWRRVAVVAVCVAWSGVEWLYGDAVWGWITLGIAAYGVWAFFIAFDPGRANKPGGEPPSKL